MKRKITMLAFAVLFTISACGQNFTNLNFELAYDLPGNPGFNGASVSVTNALPDWNAYNGDNPLTEIYYVSNSFPGVSSSVELEGGSLALSGNDLSIGLYLEGSISQTAVVPDDAASLQFEASSRVNLAVTLDGQSLSYTEISAGPGYTLYGANIPADLDGQMETLAFIEGSGETLLDDIDFSVLPVPEPSQYALIGLGVILFGFCRAWKQRRS